MIEAQHDRVMQVLAEAMELPVDRRAAFLDSTCHGEPDLRSEVEDLLECVDPAARAFDEAAEEIVRAEPERIGPYAILEPIGEGGMAIVYRARQEYPVERTVALKLIKLGMDTRQFVARFEAERQALALMDHPNVAHVYDAGSTATGRPYFVMEYVPGTPILKHCDERMLGVRHRLALFALVCDAVEHAHRRGIIHRDIKDSNVLVAEIDGQAVPKVIDFGVAKAIGPPLTSRTLHTEHGQLIGTPEYMSPEQAEHGGLDVDTRADVYSLGVLLYELIAGVQPIASDALRGADQEQVRRVIRESEPTRPSTRLSTLAGADATRIAQRRRTALPTLIRELRSELEWIPLKAMRKDREQRYRSAAELADDVRNYLAGRPLTAGPESRAYRARKFLHRHRAGVAALAAIVFLLITGIVATSWQAYRARQAEARTAAERDRAHETLAFLTNDVLAGATPEKIPDAKVRDQIVGALIMPAAKRVGEVYAGRPLTEAGVREAIQGVLRDVGRADLALPHAEAALSIRRRTLGDDHPETLQSLNDYGRVLRALGRNAEAASVYQQALERRRRVLGDDHSDTVSSLNNCAMALDALGRPAEAEPLLKEALERRRRLLGDDDPKTLITLSTLRSLGRFAEAEPLYKQALERYRRVMGEDHPATLTSLNNYAAVVRQLGRPGEAEPLLKQVLERRRQLLDENHPDLILSMSLYANVLNMLGRDAEAEPLAREALARACASPSIGPSHGQIKNFALAHAQVLERLGRRAEAAALREKFGLPGPVKGATSQPTSGATTHPT
jgi:serine/threonine protein kinase